MNIGAYEGASALKAYEKWQEVISQNIAYGSAPGFKKSDVTFDSLMGKNGGNSAAGISGSMPQVSSTINFSPGAIQHTGNQLDFAIQGDGFFKIQRANGKMGYTRDGEFHLNPDRTLVTKQGAHVMGALGPITVKGEGGEISVGPDGTIAMGKDPVGKLGVFDFKDKSKLERVGDGLFAPSDSSVQPDAVTKPQILNSCLESSNVSSLTEMVNLINVSRAYEASQKVLTSGDDNEDKAIQTLGSPPS